ncbi:endonuclease 8-like 1 [Patella vulgata]|uniref:endonuclease 8-like 1 n=1 Tax=Patella vulgata TaxID=6465 RepID=UPI00217F87E5|nr:endonuclease 8-like 1 [Patella vulgata]
MPEGPELHLSSRFINTVCRGRIFTGKVVKSEVSTKNPDIDWDEKSYTISSSSRGKELQITLTSTGNNIKKNTKKIAKLKVPENAGKSQKIFFNFGMSGRFNFCESNEMVKHSHLNFYTGCKPPMVLSFVDYRRFGRWRIDDDWAPDRGPCVILEYPQFRENVLKRLSDTAFNKPICEVLLNQKYFNGVGNYLRAEVLYRAGVRPFDQARAVLEELVDTNCSGDTKIKKENGDVLELCNRLALEVVQLGATVYNPSPDEDHSKFTAWLQCYYNPGMKNMVDHNKRTIWYAGDAGPMVPKDIKTKGMKKRAAQIKEEMTTTEDESQEEDESPKKKPRKTSNKKLTTFNQEEKDSQEHAINSPKKKTRRVTRNTLKDSHQSQTSYSSDNPIVKRAKRKGIKQNSPEKKTKRVTRRSLQDSEQPQTPGSLDIPVVKGTKKDVKEIINDYNETITTNKSEVVVIKEDSLKDKLERTKRSLQHNNKNTRKLKVPSTKVRKLLSRRKF